MIPSDTATTTSTATLGDVDWPVDSPSLSRITSGVCEIVGVVIVVFVGCVAGVGNTVGFTATESVKLIVHTERDKMLYCDKYLYVREQFVP